MFQTVQLSHFLMELFSMNYTIRWQLIKMPFRWILILISESATAFDRFNGKYEKEPLGTDLLRQPYCWDNFYLFFFWFTALFKPPSISVRWLRSTFAGWLFFGTRPYQRQGSKLSAHDSNASAKSLHHKTVLELCRHKFGLVKNWSSSK